MAIARNVARKLSADAAKSGANVLGGMLTKEGDRYLINKTDITSLLETLVDQNVLLLISPVEEENTELVRTCLTCGNEYTGPECPRCANVRSRLRGRGR